MALAIEVKDGCAYVQTPYNYDFVQGMRSVNRARWNERSKAWTAPAMFVPQIREIMMNAYGETDIEPAKEKRTVHLKFTETVFEQNKPVTIYGKTVARAFGRDSGAKVGTDVSFFKGNPTSGGSQKYWLTIIPAGSEAVLYNVPQTMLERTLPFGAVVTKQETEPENKLKGA